MKLTILDLPAVKDRTFRAQGIVEIGWETEKSEPSTVEMPDFKGGGIYKVHLEAQLTDCMKSLSRAEVDYTHSGPMDL